MKKKIATIMYLCMICINSIAQNCYTLNRNNAISDFNKGRYTEAKAKFQQANKCPDKPTSNDIQSWIKKCNDKLNEEKPPVVDPTPKPIPKPNPQPVKRFDTYIKVDGKTSTSSSLSENGGSEYFNISTDARSWSTWGVPSWCSIEDKTSSGFRLRATQNTSSNSRSDYMEVRTPNGHSARINISQRGNKNAKSASISSVTVSNGEDVDGEKGLCVHTTFNVIGMKGFKGKVSCYFYDSDGNALVDANVSTNGSYGTNESTPHVAVSKDINPGYDNSKYTNYKIYIPYSELHLSGTYSRTLKVTVIIWDYSTNEGKQIGRLNLSSFTCVPDVSYLKVDGSTSNKTKYFGESGGRTTYNVSTSASSYETWGVPSWCRIENKTSTSFTLVCERNTSRTAREDYMKVKAAGKEIKISIEQAAATGPTASITSIDQTHNVFNGYVKGMNIKLKFDVSGMQGRRIKATAWFYYADNTTKLNNAYGGQVQVSNSDIAPYENTTFTMTLFMPYQGLNMAYGWRGSLSFDIAIYDDNGNKLVRQDNNTFTYSNF